MSISSSLNAGVAGLAANATRLAGIADNIANSGTFGYKRVNTEFEGMVVTPGPASGTYSAGGVRAISSRLVDEKGGLVTSANALDLATAGRGMLPVMPSVLLGAGLGDRPMMMTSTGSFRPDAEGVLRTDSGLVLLGWPANADGTIPTSNRDSVGALQPVILNGNQTSADPTTTISLGMNLPAVDTRFGAEGDPLSTRVEYFDNLGAPESLDITFTPTVAGAVGQSNTWTMVIRDSAMDPASNVIGEYTLVFDDSPALGGTLASVTSVSGGAYDPATGTMALTVAGGPMTVGIGLPGDRDGMTQLGASFKPTNVTKDGSPVGNLTSVEIDDQGMLTATYDTGLTRRLYQIPLVDVPNINGLTALNDQVYETSISSGSFYLWDAGEGPTGTIAGFAREESTTDLAAELTSLIQTQRAYTSSAKIIQTVDEMLQETTNLKR